MAAAINFSGQALPRSMSFKAREGMTLISLPSKGSCMLKQQRIKLQQHGMSMRRQPGSKSSITLTSTRIDGYYESSPLSASDMIGEFYKCINEKNLEELDAYISDNCCFEECSFPKPFKGKKEVMQFYEQLMASMGQNVKFNIEHICEGDDFTAGVNWHLEWKGTYIPFTRGCSFYECSTEGDRLLIKKARVVIESPIKPGGIVLTLLKNLTSLFDDFPKTTEWLLKSPQVIIQYIVKIYTMFLAAFINPIVTGYINMWNFVIRLLGLALNMLINILKMFLK